MEMLKTRSMNMADQITINVADTVDREQIKAIKKGLELLPRWCECDKPEFLCYPEDGECPCGIYKHHVHCRSCGAVLQVG